MNLRKALDKAEKERRSQENGKENNSTDENEATDEKDKAITGWNAPVYSQTRAVTIDLPTAVKNHCVALSAGNFPEVNRYRVLRTQLRLMGKKRGWNTIMVTSTAPNEGKTVTSINLAATYAREYNQTVLLVDGDLKSQMIHRYLGYESQLGLLDYLEEKSEIHDVISWPGVEKLTIISGSRVINDSAEIIGSPRMKSLVTELKSRYEDRVIIFDVPPVLGMADALAFAPLVDCIVFVVAAGVTNQRALQDSLALLPQKKIAGFVVNRFKGADKLYGRYGYGYGYGQGYGYKYGKT